MAATKTGSVLIENGQTLVPFEVMTTSNRLTFKSSSAIWSGKEGSEPDIRPNGILTGRNMIIPAVSGTDDLVDIGTSFTAWSKGVEYTVAASTDETITRGATANIAKISSVTMTDAGALAIVAGVDSADATLNEVRGAAGGPPHIPLDSVEVGQVRFEGTGAGTAAPITAAQIFQVSSSHIERADTPSIRTESRIGKGTNAADSTQVTAYVEFGTAVSATTHTGDVPRRTWIQYYTPVLTELPKANNFNPISLSHSVSSSPFYQGSEATVAESIGQGSVDVILKDGITDLEIALQNEVVTVKFFQHKLKAPYSLSQGTWGLPPTFPVDSPVSATATISGTEVTANFIS